MPSVLRSGQARATVLVFVSSECTISNRQTGEMACELANMLCGAAVSYLETTNSFDLSSPELVAPESLEAVENHGGLSARESFSLENGTLTVVLRLSDQ